MNLRKGSFSAHGAKFYKYFILAAFLLTGFAVSAKAITLTQSSSHTVTAANTVECTNQTTGAVTQNSFWRAYDLSTVGSTGTFNVTSVTFGIESANAAGTGTTQPATVNLYINTGAAFPGGTRTLVATATTNISDQSLTLYNVNITAAVPIVAANQLVFELNIPDGTAAGHIFFPGSNTAAETGPSYISAPSCGVTTPTTYAAIGFPTVHLILDITGTVPTPTTLTQSSSHTVTAANTVECTNQTTGAVTQNSFWRAYSLSALGSTGIFNVTSVTFGIESANAAGTGTTQPATVNLYINTGAAFPGGTRTLVATATTNIPDQTLTLYTVPITAAIPIVAANQLVFELNIPDGTAAGHIFFPGSNTAAETGPSYISAPSCGVTTPTTYAAIGFPTVHLILDITGVRTGPTAAGATVGGRVLNAAGRGIRNVRVTVTDSNGNTRTTMTGPFGYYQFTDVPAGELISLMFLPNAIGLHKIRRFTRFQTILPMSILSPTIKAVE